MLSPWLFNIFMDRIMREVKERLQGGVQLTTTLVEMLLFADDIIVCTKMKEDMERNLAIRCCVKSQLSIRNIEPDHVSCHH